jgi:anaerobic sulfite reductase subunit B
MTTACAAPLSAHDPMVPRLYRVASRRRETNDVITLSLVPESGEVMEFQCGQFTMLTAFGVGEAPISVSSPPRGDRALEHTIRDVGAVTHALCQSEIGSQIGVRGPFGTDWGLSNLHQASDATGLDVVVVAGGIGLAPLRGAIAELVQRGTRQGIRIFVLAGAREPSQVVFAQDLGRWSAMGAYVAVTVDVAAPGWDGDVGMVTALLAGAGFDPDRTSALICGPEVMMRFTARALVDLGVDASRIRLSLERNMQCGLGWCGHCQLGPLLLCRDGPVVRYENVVAEMLTQRER